MSKAEKYIKAYTRSCSNELVGGGYHEWLPVEDALTAVELAREELIKDASKLKWQDIQRIVQIADHLCNSLEYDKIRDMGEEGYYTEILDRFNKEK